MKKLDDSKFCFISCVNDDFFYDECQLYLQHLNFPQGMCGEIVAVRDAKSMTAGYQAAMEASDAKYKIYLHQDVFVVNKNILHELLMLFRHNPRIGMIGVAGASGALLQLMACLWRLSMICRGEVICLRIGIFTIYLRAGSLLSMVMRLWWLVRRSHGWYMIAVL